MAKLRPRISEPRSALRFREMPPFLLRYFDSPTSPVDIEPMNLSSKERLALLGSGRPIDEVCSAAHISREEFDRWWDDETRSRVPAGEGSRQAPVGAAVEIERDEWGIPHIRAASDDDLFFGFGYAMAQDRLFQLDYLRRKASGKALGSPRARWPRTRHNRPHHRHPTHSQSRVGPVACGNTPPRQPLQRRRQRRDRRVARGSPHRV